MLHLVECKSRQGQAPWRLSNRASHRRSDNVATSGYGLSYRIARSGSNHSVSLMASDTWAAAEQEDWTEAIRLASQDAGSLRALSRNSGIPRSTLQGLLSGRTGAPSERTIDRFLTFLSQSPVTRTGRLRTVVDDSRLWTGSKLANLEPPAGATFFQIIGKPSIATGQPSHTQYISTADHHPADFLSEPGFSARDVSRIVWAFGRKRG